MSLAVPMIYHIVSFREDSSIHFLPSIRNVHPRQYVRCVKINTGKIYDSLH